MLHDTQGFPIDLTLEMAAEAGLTVDTDEFRRLMQEQRDRARADAKARKGKLADLSVYRVAGRRRPDRVHRLLRAGDRGHRPGADPGRRPGAVAPSPVTRSSWCWTAPRSTPNPAVRTPTAGLILGNGASAEVLDVQKVDKKLIVHRVRITDGEFTEGAAVLAKVDPEWRLGARQAHSGTHVVHAALRQVLGPEALQAGSYNKPGYLRLDFSWGQALSAETRSELEEVANRAVRQDLPVRVLYGSQAEAQAMGAIALFGETYDDTVRIVEIGGPWSVELCGGTHVEHSSQIGPVAITAESSVGSGLRRVEAAVGIEAFHRLAAERTLVVPAGRLAEGAAERTARPDRGAAGTAAGRREGTVRAARRGAVRVGGHHGPGCRRCRRRRAGRGHRAGGHPGR